MRPSCLQRVNGDRVLQTLNSLSFISCIPQSSVCRKKECSQPVWETINPRSADHMRLWPFKKNPPVLKMEEYLVIQDLFKCTHIGAQIHFCGMLVNGGKMWEYFGTGATGAH